MLHACVFMWQYVFLCLPVCKCAAVILSLGRLWSFIIMLASEKGDKMPVLASVAAFDYTSVFLCVESESLCLCVRVGALALNSWPSLWATVFPSSRFSIVNEEDRRERGLLVLIYPGGSLGITINSQLLAHSTGPHRHCQFVPIREPSFWVFAVRGCSGPTGEQPVWPWIRTWPHWAWLHLGDETCVGYDHLLYIMRQAQLNMLCDSSFFSLRKKLLKC